jgi:hypothetical protein
MAFWARESLQILLKEVSHGKENFSKGVFGLWDGFGINHDWEFANSCTARLPESGD